MSQLVGYCDLSLGFEDVLAFLADDESLGDILVLGGECRHDVGQGKPEPVEAVRVDDHTDLRLPAAEYLHVGNLGDLQEVFLDLVVRQLPDLPQIGGVARLGGEGQGHGGLGRLADLVDRRGPDVLRQAGTDSGEGVGNIGCRDVEALFVLEFGQDDGDLVLRSGRHPPHEIDGGKFLFDGAGDVGLDVGRRRAGHDGDDADLGTVHVGEEIEGHLQIADDSHRRQQQDNGKNQMWPCDVPGDDFHGLPLTGFTWLPSVSPRSLFSCPVATSSPAASFPATAAFPFPVPRSLTSRILTAALSRA